MQANVCKASDRLTAVRTLFKNKGAKDDDLKTEKHDSAENLVVTVKGKSSETIIVGAHYDRVELGCGAIDNWTGIVILANLYKSLKDANPEKTIVFVAFDKKESGLDGSIGMAKSIPKETRNQYCSMVNFESFGFNPPQVLSNTSSPKLIKFARELAGEVQMPFTAANITEMPETDSSSFMNKGVPALTFHGLSVRWADYLHKSRDILENVNPQSVLVGYRFGLLYLQRLDSKPCDSFR